MMAEDERKLAILNKELDDLALLQNEKRSEIDEARRKAALEGRMKNRDEKDAIRRKVNRLVGTLDDQLKLLQMESEDVQIQIEKIGSHAGYNDEVQKAMNTGRLPPDQVKHFLTQYSARKSREEARILRVIDDKEALIDSIRAHYLPEEEEAINLYADENIQILEEEIEDCQSQLDEIQVRISRAVEELDKIEAAEQRRSVNQVPQRSSTNMNSPSQKTGRNSTYDNTSPSQARHFTPSDFLPAPSAPVHKPKWHPDRDHPACELCKGKFTTFNRRHHCRRCGLVVCNVCSNYRRPVPELNIKSLTRVCKNCMIAPVVL